MRSLKFLLAVCLLLYGWSACAEDNQLTGYDEDAAPELEPREVAPGKWHFLAGTGPAWLQRYEGASTYGVRAVPLFQASNGNFFAGTLGGMGYYLQKLRELSYGIRIGATPGRQESADPVLAGTGDLRAAAEVGVFIKGKQEHLYWLAKISGGARGGRAEVGGGIEFRENLKDGYRLGVTANFASQAWMQTYFGINTEQAVSSGLPAYDAAGGMRSVGVVAGWSHLYDRNWLGNLALSGKQLAGSAASSPLVQSASSYALSYVVIYLF